MQTRRYDMVLLSLPWWDMEVPQCGPAVLKGIAQSQGYSLLNVDCNADLYWNHCGGNHNRYVTLADYFVWNRHTEAASLIDAFYEGIMHQLENLDFRYLGLSVFSVWTHRSVFDLLERLQGRGYQTVLGGRGASVKPFASVWSELTGREKLMDFGRICQQRRWADVLLQGDAEDSILDLLSDTPVDQTHRLMAQQPNLDYPFSNFDDINIQHYLPVKNHRRQLPVITSKGCVRSCDFCDVAAHMDKFRSKNGSRVAEEMIWLSQRYNNYSFAFTDSILNGNLKSLRQAAEILSKYNQSNPDKKLSWAGNWICRPRGIIRAEFFDLLAEAGCESVAIGAEHGSDRVLKAMNKKTDVDGLYYEIEHFDRHGINVIINTIVGHWSETFDDFLELILMWVKLAPYSAKGTISNFSLGLFMVLENTPAADQPHVNGIIKAADNFTQAWYTSHNRSLTVRTRLLRVLTMIRIARHLNLPMYGIRDFLIGITHTLERQKPALQKLNHSDTSLLHCSATADFVADPMPWITDLLRQHFNRTHLIVSGTAFHCNGAPRLKISWNDHVLHDAPMSQGNFALSFSVAYDLDHGDALKIQLLDKQVADTEIDAQGKIIQDKCVNFDTIGLDGINMLDHLDFFQQQLQYFNGTDYQMPTLPGLWFNSSWLALEFRGPFWRHLLSFAQHECYNNHNDIDDALAQVQKLLPEFDY